MRKMRRIEESNEKAHVDRWRIHSYDDTRYSTKKGEATRSSGWHLKPIGQVIEDVLRFFDLAYYNDDLMSREQVEKLAKVLGSYEKNK